ncbi:MAG: stage II sporulation protein R [Oscillospiraceae bacterium]
MKKYETVLLFSLIFALFGSFFADVNIRAEKVRKNTLRLHIIAATDNAYDQQIKLNVRDAILNLSGEIYRDSDSFPKAVSATRENINLLNAISNDTLERLGATYKAQCSVETFYFDTTEYEDFTMPKGEYTALTVRLGQGEGKNWWCVLYPELCIGAADCQYEDADSSCFIQTEKYNIKFKAVEVFEEVKDFFSREEKQVYSHI